MIEERLFPREVTNDIPRITMVGNELVRVEQHCGLAVYQPDMILFKAAGGQIRLTGSRMVFQTYTAAEASVTGEIDTVSMEYTAGGKAGT